MINSNIKTFLTVCEKKSFTRAAAALYVTPSAVLQQINALEKQLGVKLVERHRSGITLTPAGTYLKEAGTDLLGRSEIITAQLKAIALNQNTISIGTSLLEKCRLLYDLWMIYSSQSENAKVNLVTLTRGQPIPPETDLIESINSGVPWMLEWNFFKICDIPFGFAVDRHHPLSAKKSLRLDDLRGETVVCFSNTSSPVLKEIFSLMETSGIRTQMYNYPQHSILQGSAFHHQILLSPLCWSDILVNMTIIPCQWDYSVPYGIFYRKDPSEQARLFLSFIRKTYTEGNDQNIVPVF